MRLRLLFKRNYTTRLIAPLSRLHRHCVAADFIRVGAARGRAVRVAFVLRQPRRRMTDEGDTECVCVCPDDPQQQQQQQSAHLTKQRTRFK